MILSPDLAAARFALFNSALESVLRDSLSLAATDEAAVSDFMACGVSTTTYQLTAQFDSGYWAAACVLIDHLLVSNNRRKQDHRALNALWRLECARLQSGEQD